MDPRSCQMFCNQCEQTAKGTGCTTKGACGKNSNVATLQDLLIYALKGLSHLAAIAQTNNIDIGNIEILLFEALFATVTNVDFSEEKIAFLVRKICKTRDEIKTKIKTQNIKIDDLPDAATFVLSGEITDMIRQGHVYKIIDQRETNQDIQSLKNTLLYGMKGIAAYADHAAILGQKDLIIYTFFIKALANMLRYDLSLDEWLALLMECGKVNLRTMELLDQAHTLHYGNPVPTEVPLGPRKGKAILISGHDLHDLELLLKQTADQSIVIYTHGEMLPAHGYPELKKYKHLHGHYGTAWQNQHQEFAAFPGVILMTTNCIQEPLDSYKDRIFTTGLVAWPNITHVDHNKDFSPIINKALELPGFIEDTHRDSVMVGFSHHTVLGIANKIIELVKQQKIRHFFLVAGCDGAKPGRNYYTEFVEKVPNDCIILTLACGKFRFFDKKLGDIAGIPRLLDIGQCNDAYSAIKIAVALADAFNCSVNELPLSLVLSWYEQKAVAILLTLLALGIKNIRLGPSLPAFITPKVLNVLVEKFNIQSITNPDDDLAAILSVK
jgi:hydroxylamine reductase